VWPARPARRDPHCECPTAQARLPRLVLRRRSFPASMACCVRLHAGRQKRREARRPEDQRYSSPATTRHGSDYRPYRTGIYASSTRFAAAHMVESGPKRHFVATQQSVAIGIKRTSTEVARSEDDPPRSMGRVSG
jgi:hypothetical protein